MPNRSYAIKRTGTASSLSRTFRGITVSATQLPGGGQGQRAMPQSTMTLRYHCNFYRPNGRFPEFQGSSGRRRDNERSPCVGPFPVPFLSTTRPTHGAIMNSATENSTAPTSELYDRHYYRHDCGPTPYDRSPAWHDLFSSFSDHIIGRISPRTVLDAGCAIGLLVEELRLRGVEAWGVDVSEYAIGKVAPAVQEFVRLGDLSTGLPDGMPLRFDLITCIEVLEHIPAVEAERALDTICSATDAVLFSSSPQDLDEATHVNVRPPEDWTALFAARGFRRSRLTDVSFITPWAMLFERGSTRAVELVRQYERDLARAENEVGAVRAELLRLSRAFAAVRPEHDEETADGQSLDQRLTTMAAMLETLHGENAALRAENNEVTLRAKAHHDEAKVLRDGADALRRELDRLGALNLVLEGEIDAAAHPGGYGAAEAGQARALVEMIYASETWKVGRAVTAPLRLVNRLRRHA